ncbi:MAG: rRNA maturation RNase YbeY [Gammaproteobacteria bacterium]|nr:rRNA maturation RNase YbeY [Gammaproteobacteria bacterium]MDE0514100.1 rRNA maturation RNase YbeY [Gammaproteobacteria bacterium]
MGADITVQFVTAEASVPAEKDILHWAGSALALDGGGGEVTIRITDEDEMQSLNSKWRNIDKPTNVLSFPLHDAGCPLLGDIVVCAPVVRREAAQQAIALSAHWAHIIIHGILHLMGYDHTEEREAEIMEAKETALMLELGFPDPYFPGITTSAANSD